MNELLKDNFKDLKEQIQYYSENNKQGNVKFIIQQTEGMGETASKELEEILKEVDVNIEEYK